MMAIQTATPEQVCDCVMALKRHIDRVEAELQRARAENEQQAQQLQDTRAWAALWKRAAKYERGLKMFCRRHYARHQEYAEERIRQDAAENERLREALNDARMAERARCLNIISSYVLRTKVKPFGAVGQALDFIMHEMGARHE